ncbi:MAG: hypothetical protein QM658_03005 [Gordonia sp. (in: high G+C Gram-positive bacteria)]
MNRTANVVRMQLVNQRTFIWLPLTVLGGSFAVSLAIYAIINSTAHPDQPIYGGGVQAPLWYFAAIGVQALTLTFPFSQAMSVTRREFYLGTMLTAALTAVGLAVIFVVAGLIENATDGWGVNGYFFHLPWIWKSGPLAAGFAFFVAALLVFTVGFWGSTIFKRAGMTGIVVLGIALALVAVLAIWLLTKFDGWAPFWRWINDQGALGLAGWGLLLTAALSAVSYATLRRAIP